MVVVAFVESTKKPKTKVIRMATTNFTRNSLAF